MSRRYEIAVAVEGFATVELVEAYGTEGARETFAVSETAYEFGASAAFATLTKAAAAVGDFAVSGFAGRVRSIGGHFGGQCFVLAVASVAGARVLVVPLREGWGSGRGAEGRARARGHERDHESGCGRVGGAGDFAAS